MLKARSELNISINCVTLDTMNTTKYISLEKLKIKFRKIINEVLESEIEYIVMVDQCPRFTIKPINDKEGKKVLVKSKKYDEKIGKFID